MTTVAVKNGSAQNVEDSDLMTSGSPREPFMRAVAIPSRPSSYFPCFRFDEANSLKYVGVETGKPGSPYCIFFACHSAMDSLP